MGSRADTGRGTRTVLITDMVESTALRSRLGDNEADRLRDEHERLLRDAVIGARGSTVKSTGDGIMAVFEAASDAIEGSVAMQQAVARQARRTGLPLQIRIGVAAGDVTWDPDDYHGTPVVQAARLEPKARPGRVLVSSLVKLLAGSRTDVDFTPAGRLELKGLPEPLEAYEIEPPASAADAEPPLPSALRDPAQAAFVGRRAERDTIHEAWSRVDDGTARLLVVTGEAGIGKTRLAAEVARDVYGGGGTVLFGRCDEDLDVPYQPFVEALRYFVDQTPAAFLHEELGAGAGELVRLVPELADRLHDIGPAPGNDADTARYRLFEAVCAWLAAASHSRRVLLVLDDLQWGSKGTILLARHIVRSALTMRVLLLATWRDSDTGERNALAPALAELTRTGDVDRVSMGGLAPAEVARFLEKTVETVADGPVAHAVSDRLSDALYQKTEGNPFFVQEVTHDLLDVSGYEVESLDADAVARFGVPETVREVVLRRVGRLSDEVARVLGASAVVGRTFDVAVLEDILSVQGDEVIDALDTAVAARLVRERSEVVGRFEFAHALVRDVLYAQLGTTRRARLHERIARALERLHPGATDCFAADIAGHLSASGRARPAQVVDYLLQAGNFALHSLAYEQAVEHFERALEVLERGDDVPTAERLDVLLALGDARMRVLDFAGSKKALQQAADEARAQGDPERLARAALGSVRHAQPFAKDFALSTLLDEAITALPGGDSALRAQLLSVRAAQSFLNTYEGPRPDMVAEAVAMAQRLGDPTDLAFVLGVSVLATFGPAMLDERRRYVEMQITEAERSGHTEAACEAYGWRATARIEAAERAGVDDDVETMQRLADRLGQPWYRAMAQQRRAMVAQLSGRYDTAEALANEALSASTPDQVAVMAAYAGLTWALRRDQGRLAEVEPAFQAFASQMPDVAAWPATLAVGALEQGRPDDARAALHSLADRGFDTIATDWLCLAALSLSGEVAAALEERASAAALYEQLLPYAGRGIPIAIGVGYLGTTSRALGLMAHALGRVDDAVMHLDDAVRIEASMGAPAYLARAELALARALLARDADGDAPRAQSLLERATAAANELGLPGVAAQLAAVTGTR